MNELLGAVKLSLSATDIAELDAASARERNVIPADAEMTLPLPSGPQRQSAVGHQPVAGDEIGLVAGEQQAARAMSIGWPSRRSAAFSPTRPE